MKLSPKKDHSRDEVTDLQTSLNKKRVGLKKQSLLKAKAEKATATPRIWLYPDWRVLLPC